MIKKVLLTSALVASFAATANAGDSSEVSGPQVTLGGSLDTQLGYVQQKKAFRHSNPSDTTTSKLNNHSLVNDTKLWVKIDGEAESGLKYGGMVKLNADTSKAKEDFFADTGDSNRRAEQTMAYVEGAFGHIEMGNTHGASHAMHVDASTFARATGGIIGDAKYWWNSKAADGNNFKDLFLVSPNLPTNNLGQVGSKGVNAGKVSYYTPSFSGFMIGLSYTPDVQSYGTVAEARGVTTSVASRQAFKNVFEAGLKYEYMFDQVGVKAALTGQAGDSKKVNTAGALNKTYRSLKAWNAGLNLNFMGVNLGGSYGDWGKSTVRKDTSAKGTKYWTLGAGYEFGPAGVSLTYANTQTGVQENAKRNKLEMLSLGLDYKLAPGLMPYAEVTCFKSKDNTFDGATTYASNKGTVFLLGSKLQF
ncbi:outer membrane protein porin [endosymbiont of Acanthamoeba sp. UWC8]|uniref:porin n=1 Tax=endosymbiont of Acanthamoeba sp. UWC8 TaxID=86106 RepID=UPI0004D1307A|nr:porin [endosymbiont of Acanthamoeba sp. UWC8]AIF81189.1 outer membrane protein porin [endosymbiont of Acanthamoeba sp. UWC8]